MGCLLAVRAKTRTSYKTGVTRVQSLWDLPRAKLIYILRGHSQTVPSVALTGDKKTLVSGSWDGSIKVWGLA
ncbi:WD40 repeat domain-containing protein [Nostoc sp.]|uniref:WD40 repeat domain-containing protein n=1 Tax=Nostoc sp. TaxID=1180 RepID=UPI003FA5DE16